MQGKFPRSHRRGIALVWATLTMLVVVGLLGLAVDTGFVYITGQQLQNAADAGALFGAQALWINQSQARANASDGAHANQASRSPVVVHPAEDVVIGRFDRRDGSFVTAVTPPAVPNAIKVTAHRTEAWETLGLIFGPINTPNGSGLPDFDAPRANISRSAIARVGGNGCLIALDPTAECALETQGNFTLNSPDCDIQVNSTAAGSCPNRGAVCAGGGPTIDAEAINVGGTACIGGNVDFDGDVNTGSPPVNDPLSFLPDLDYSGAVDRGTIVSLNGDVYNPLPGHYPGGIRVNGGTVTCAPGIYVCNGAGFSITGGNFTAQGCMFYLVGGLLDIRGNGTIAMSPISLDDPTVYDFSTPPAAIYEGLSIFQARTNTNLAQINGTGSMDIRGALYFPQNRVDIRGTGDVFNLDQLVAWRVTLGGTGTFNIGSTGNLVGIALDYYLVQ